MNFGSFKKHTEKRQAICMSAGVVLGVIGISFSLIFGGDYWMLASLGFGLFLGALSVVIERIIND